MVTKKRLGGLVCGVGVNDADYAVSPKIDGKRDTCPFYKKWAYMLARAYSGKRSAYENVLVCQEWLTFSSFRSWMETQDWLGKDLDKDIVSPGNKLYSPSTCCFVAPEINSLLVGQGTSNCSAQGVTYNKTDNRYISRVSENGTIKYLGCFTSHESAHAAYAINKSKHLTTIAHQQADTRVAAGLLRHAAVLLDSIESGG